MNRIPVIGSDGPVLDGYCVLAEIADDIIKFEVEMK